MSDDKKSNVWLRLKRGVQTIHLILPLMSLPWRLLGLLPHQVGAAGLFANHLRTRDRNQYVRRKKEKNPLKMSFFLYNYLKINNYSKQRCFFVVPNIIFFNHRHVSKHWFWCLKLCWNGVQAMMVGLGVVPGKWSFFGENKRNFKNDNIVLKNERIHRTHSLKYWN